MNPTAEVTEKIGICQDCGLRVTVVGTDGIVAMNSLVNAMDRHGRIDHGGDHQPYLFRNTWDPE